MKGLEIVKCRGLRINMFRITPHRKISKFSRNNISEQSVEITYENMVHAQDHFLKAICEKENLWSLWKNAGIASVEVLNVITDLNVIKS